MLDVQEVHPAMLPVGRWFYLLPDQRTVITSDLPRLKREIAAEIERRKVAK